MMKLMNKKLTKKGFTLAELLIVVAILAILVAVSIPIFTSKLHDAKDSTDMANIRAAKAAAVAAYMSNDKTGAARYYYDAVNGIVLDGSNSDDLTKAIALTGYSQCSDGACDNGGAKGANQIVKISIADTGAATAIWVTAKSTTDII